MKGQAAPVSLEVLRVWLGRLLGLGKPPSVAECADGRLLRAALAKMQSSQPALSAAPAALLSAVAPQDATFAALAGELDAAGLGQPPGVLDAAAAGDTATLEGLLLTIYQYYAHNHAHKFSKPITQPPPLPPLLPSSGGGGQPLPAVTPLPGRPHVSATGELLAPGPTTAKQHQPSASEAAEPAHPDSSWNKRPPGSAELLACGLGLPDERWMAATQASLAVWLGTAAGVPSPLPMHRIVLHRTRLERHCRQVHEARCQINHCFSAHWPVACTCVWKCIIPISIGESPTHMNIPKLLASPQGTDRPGCPDQGLPTPRVRTAPTPVCRDSHAQLRH